MSSTAADTPKKGPFDVIVITSPDVQSAIAARELIISSCGDFSSLSKSADQYDKNNDCDNNDYSAPVVMQSTNDTIYISSCDPYGARMGSGGGTIAALAEADEAYTKFKIANANNNHNYGKEEREEPTVLICHAGGESSRCPTQIVLGKAWTSLPVVRRHREQQQSASSSSSVDSGNFIEQTSIDHDSTSTTVSNPTSLLISSLSDIFEDIPKGSVVVAASDVLLSFDNDDKNPTDEYRRNRKINFDSISKPNNDHYNHVLGLAVPAPLETAKNHGVFVQQQALNSADNDDDQTINNEWQIQKTYQVLQKPSRDEMKGMTNPSCTFTKKENDMAWIDTGVITFLPNSAKTLRELAISTLKSCTRSGLKQMYKEATKRDAPPSIKQYAKATSPKICLYGDMLHALRTTTNNNDGGERNGNASTMLDALSTKLSQHELHTCTIPAGSFVHLGTTKELLDFLTMGGDNTISQNFGKALGLTRRADSFVSGFTAPSEGNDSSGNSNNIVINSVLLYKGGSNSRLGKNSVIEHCHIECDNEIQIGDGAVVSGIRGGSVKGSSFHVPDGICLQLLPLRQSSSFVCICIGVEDSIKDAPTNVLYGKKLQSFPQTYGLSEADLWDESIPLSKRMIWNAKINPILTPDDDGNLDYSFLDWIAMVVAGDNSPESSAKSSAMIGFKQWKEATRLPLCEIRKCVDSEVEARYRSSISSKKFENRRLTDVSEILMKQRHEPCNFDYVVDSVSSSNYCTEGLMRALKALDDVVSHASTKGQYDIVGRCFSTMAILIDDTIKRGNDASSTGDGNVDKAKLETLMKDSNDGLKALQISQNTLTSIISIRNTIMKSQDQSFKFDLVAFLEKLSSVMTERCVSGNITGVKPAERALPIPIGSVAMASAPARIDLAGGWSDTPPISFEHGGAVACLAVLVDGKRPLRAQCRMTRKGGIKLRTESRSLDDEALLNSAEVNVLNLEHLSDYNNPMEDCALLKCALLQLGLVSLDSIRAGDDSPIQPHLKKFCQSDADDIGLEIISQSFLPTGSGMGSSSILGGCIIASIAKCVGITLTGMADDDVPTQEVEVNDANSLIHAVLETEQLLTTGGGWQDNIGGLVGGLKLGSSDAHFLPLQTKVQRFDLSQPMIDELNQRLILAFSGKPRLAKNILSNVLRRWARRSEEIMTTVDGLVKGAEEAIQCIQNEDLDSLGKVVSQYWQYKIAMAGVDSGVEPKSVHDMLEMLSSRGDIVGGTLCGAGGGGFLAMLASTGKTSKDIETTVKQTICNGNNSGLESFSWYSCTVSKEGLMVDVVHENDTA